MAVCSRSVTAQPMENSRCHAAVSQCSDVGEERLGCAGAVGADQDRVAVPMLVGDLRQR